MVHVVVCNCVSVAPIEAIDHERHVTPATLLLLLLLQVIELQFGDAISILPLAVHPY